MSNYYCDYEYEISSTHKENQNSNDANTKRRVKLYHLNQEGQWDDKGTGYVNIARQVNKYFKERETTFSSL
jgi:hypothetical protein